MDMYIGPALLTATIAAHCYSVSCPPEPVRPHAPRRMRWKPCGILGDHKLLVQGVALLVPACHPSVDIQHHRILSITSPTINIFLSVRILSISFCSSSNNSTGQVQTRLEVFRRRLSSASIPAVRTDQRTVCLPD
ncbi:hypothetical protein BS50DRAFT_131086 [Corynespora cassiicola Philippines]|uniref:Uncharacterized protein n=1 Tax=Corynespora cassiicola Philippines TaxID=1448308 RepID=A0A2T2NBQ9_CORCC|nr:hypothetical protein BS50DRAFT_131086 [Corynespora cassiicola Philippines]